MIIPSRHGNLEIHMEIAQDKYVVENKNGRNGQSWDSPEWECWAVASFPRTTNLSARAKLLSYITF